MSRKRWLAATSKKLRNLLFFALVLYVSLQHSLDQPIPNEHAPIQIYSNHLGDDLRYLLVHALTHTQDELSLTTFGLTEQALTQQLSNMAKRGCAIHIQTDPQFAKKIHKILPREIEYSFPVQKGLIHQKSIVIDRSLCFVGTANLTGSSLREHDNLIVGVYSSLLANAINHRLPSCVIPLPEQTLTYYSLPDSREQALKSVLEQIRNATSSIDVAAFTFTHKQIIDDLLQAHRRGVQVKIYLDKRTYAYGRKKLLKPLIEAGVPIAFNRGAALFHYKCMMIDGKTLLFGSANFTKAAFQTNADMLFTLSPLTQVQQKQLKSFWKKIHRSAFFT